MLTWLLMMRPFFKSGSQKVYTNLDIDLSANIYIYIYIYAFSRRFYPKRLTIATTYRLSAFKYKELLIIGIGRNFHIGASLVINNVLFQFIPEVQIKVI